jgi:hypothetical protein
MKNRLEQVVNVAIAFAAIAVGGAVIRRELRPARSNVPLATKPELMPEWQSALGDGMKIGTGKSGAIQIMEFVDVQCPALTVRGGTAMCWGQFKKSLAIELRRR